MTMMEENIDFTRSWDVMNASRDQAFLQDAIVQGSWEPSISDTVNNDGGDGEAKTVAQNSATTNGGYWTEDEHRLFLLGLEKHGKGKWKHISVEFVKTRSPSQVASHAQKHFKRLGNSARQTKRRSSIFDIDITHDDQKMLGVQVNEANETLESGYNVDNHMEDCWIELPSFEDDDLPSSLFYVNSDVLQYQMETVMVDHDNDKLGVQVTTTTTTPPSVVNLVNGALESGCVGIDEPREDYWLELPILENLPTLWH